MSVKMSDGLDSDRENIFLEIKTLRFQYGPSGKGEKSLCGEKIASQCLTLISWHLKQHIVKGTFLACYTKPFTVGATVCLLCPHNQWGHEYAKLTETTETLPY